MTLVFVACEENVHPDQETPNQNQKTLFMYFPWSGNLTSYFYQNIEDMEETIARIGLEDERVIVFISTSSTDAEMFEITCEKGICTRDILKEYSNPPITTREGITAILNDMKAFAPAPVYAMTIGCHGMGWVPVESAEARSAYRIIPHWEYTDGPLTRYFGGTTAAYQTDITTLAGGLEDAGIVMEYILFDDCYMSSIEAAYDLRLVTDHIIACPTEIMAYGMPYSTIGEHLLGDPDYEAINKEFYDFYSNYTYPYGTLGITDCKELDALASIMKEINSRYSFDESLQNGLQRMDGYTPVLFYDFGDYVTKLCGDADLLAAFNAQLERTVPYKTHTEQYYSAYRGEVDIHTYSGITTSEPSKHRWAAKVTETNWYKATH